MSLPLPWQDLMAVPLPKQPTLSHLTLITRPITPWDQVPDAVRALWTAIERNQLDAVRALLDEGADFRAGMQINSLLHQTLGNGQVAMARLLSEKGARLDEQSQGQPLHLLDTIIRRDDVDTLRQLPEWGVDLGQLDVRLFLERGAGRGVQWWLAQDPTRLEKIPALSDQDAFVWMIAGVRGTPALRETLNQAWGLMPGDLLGFYEKSHCERRNVGNLGLNFWRDYVLKKDDPWLMRNAMDAGWGTLDCLGKHPCTLAALQGAWKLYDWMIQLPALAQDTRQQAQGDAHTTWLMLGRQTPQALERMQALGVDLFQPDEEGRTLAHEIVGKDTTSRGGSVAWLVEHRPRLLLQPDREGKTPLDLASEDPARQAWVQTTLAEVQARLMAEDTPVPALPRQGPRL